MTPHRRLFDVRASLKMTQKQMASILGIGQNAYSMIETGKIAITLRNRSILERELGINPDYLLSGELPMIVNSNSSNDRKNHCGSEKIQGQAEGRRQGVPYYTKSINPTSTPALKLDTEDVEFYIDFEPFNDCTFYRPVFGQSMSPRYNSGDIIACKSVNKSNILYGQSYLCVIANAGDTYESLAVLRRGENNSESEVVLAPVNTHFDKTTIPLSSIVELYLICGRIERHV